MEAALGDFYHVQTDHGTWLAVDAASGRIVSCHAEKSGPERARLIVYVPDQRDAAFLLSPFHHTKIYLPPVENRSAGIRLGMRLVPGSSAVLFTHPESKRYICAAPLEQGEEFGNVAIHGFRADRAEMFRLTPLPDALVPAELKGSARQLEASAGAADGNAAAARQARSAAGAVAFRQPVDHGLIVDIGMSDGNDTQFYLRKGFRVVGVEADPVVFEALRTRFAGAIANGRLTILHRVAQDLPGQTVEFWRDEQYQIWSSTLPNSSSPVTRFEVQSIDWGGIVEIGGAPPHYCKMDIEGDEKVVLRSMLGSTALPTFISVEALSFEPIEMLFLIGYRRFKLVNQTILQTFELPYPPREGQYVPDPDWANTSGPFGEELMGDRWLDFKEVGVAYDMIQRLNSYRTALHAWFDCHAWMPD